jgi:pheromone shutdown protein TraB
VLHIAFDGDDARRRAADAPGPTARLRHPTTGADVHVIGTAHVSGASADHVRAAILAERPDTVVIELCPGRLASLVERALSTRSRTAHHKVGTFGDALRVVVSGGFVPTALSVAYACVGAVMGGVPGAEFLAAVDAAKDVGAQVVLGDVDERLIFARILSRMTYGDDAWKRWKLDREAAAAASSSSSSGGGGKEEEDAERRRVDAATAAVLDDDAAVLVKGKRTEVPRRWREGVVRAIVAAKCENPGDVERALYGVLDPSGEVDPADVATLRKCGTRAMDFVMAEIATSGDLTKLMKGDAAKKGEQKWAWATMETLSTDRDLVLAHSLQRSRRAKRIVGVVGAAHVRGIERLWEDVPTAASQRAYDGALSPTPFGRDARGGSAWDRTREMIFSREFAYICGAAVSLGVARGAYSVVENARANVRRLRASGMSDEEIMRSPKTKLLEAPPRAAASVGRALRSAARTTAIVVAVPAVVAAAAACVGASALVSLGNLATRLEAAASRAEEAGIVARRRPELRSKRWGNEVDERGNRLVQVEAINAVSKYDKGVDGGGRGGRGRGGEMLYR